MVYFYTSGNVKTVKNLLQDYQLTEDQSPLEYIKTFIENCPENSNDARVAWTVETFLGVQKHHKFLQDLCDHNISPSSSNDEKASLVVVLYGIMFEIEPKDTDQVYKCLFNLNKKVLDRFTSFLSNNEVLTFISQLARSYYDTIYVTDKIIAPLFSWQPYISEMAHNYSEYVKKTERRKMKLPTVPIQPNVLSHKSKKATLPILPPSPPNSLQSNNRKMLDKSMIDKRLQNEHRRNKEKAAYLLSEAKSNDQHYTQGKSEKYKQKMHDIRNAIDNEFKAPPKTRHKIITNSPVMPIKETAASLRRIHKRIQMEEQEEIFWLQNLIDNCSNATNYELLEEQDRQIRERERLVDIEKKHLMGQISHEEAIISKKKLQEENKRKYEDFLKEKEIWYDEIEQWKMAELQKNQKQVEKLSLMELSLNEARTNAVLKKKETADKVKSELEALQAEALRAKNDELERRINVIKEIKILSLIAKKSKVPKIIDLTETSGLGLLCEMSMADLQERLNAFKMTIKEELEIKRKTIHEENEAAKQELERTKANIRSYMSERALLKAQNKKHEVASNSNISIQSSKEICNLKKMLEDKRKLRMKMTSELMV